MKTAVNYINKLWLLQRWKMNNLKVEKCLNEIYSALSWRKQWHLLINTTLFNIYNDQTQTSTEPLGIQSKFLKNIRPVDSTIIIYIAEIISWLEIIRNPEHKHRSDGIWSCQFELKYGTSLNSIFCSTYFNQGVFSQGKTW